MLGMAAMKEKGRAYLSIESRSFECKGFSQLFHFLSQSQQLVRMHPLDQAHMSNPFLSISDLCSSDCLKSFCLAN